MIFLKTTYHSDTTHLLLELTIIQKLPIILTQIFSITIMLCRLLDESAGHFFQPEEFENVENTDIKNLKHLQNQGNSFLTEPIMSGKMPS